MDKNPRSLHSDGRIYAVRRKHCQAVLSPERFAELMRAGKIEFPTVTVEEIEDLNKVDGFSKTIALGQTSWFIAQCLGSDVLSMVA
jgi:hypothetical protein